MGAIRIVAWMVAAAVTLGLAAWIDAAESGESSGGRLASEQNSRMDEMDKAPAAEKAEPLVIRTYYVKDLMLGSDLPFQSTIELPVETAAGPSLHMRMHDESSGNAPPARPHESNLGSALTSEILLDLIERTFSGNWADEGGSARIDLVGALLVVKQTEAVHKKIADLLSQFRTARPMLLIDARWVLIDEDKVAKLVPEDAKKRTVPQEVTEAGLKDAAAKVVYRGQTTCFDRQLVHLVSGRAEGIVSRVEPVVSEAAMGWSPTISTLFQGALLEVEPALSPDGKSVTLNVTSLVTEDQKFRTQHLVGVASGTAGGAPQTAKAEVELPEYLIHTFRTSVRIPLDKPVLIAGMTSPKALDGKVLYLVVSVSASKEAEPAAKPAAEAPRTTTPRR